MANLVFTLQSEALAPTTLQSSVTHNGVTFTLNKSMPVGTFVTGEPFIVSTEAFQITATSPASADLNADGSIGNGMMQDPYVPDGGSQGFDEYLNAGTGGLSSSNSPYSAALNVDPSKPGGSAISVGLGDETSFVKAIRLAGASATSDWQSQEKYAYLHVVPSTPFADCYPPSVSELPPRTYFRRSDVDMSTLRSLTFPASWPSFAGITSRIGADEGQFGIFVQGVTAEIVRRYRLDDVLGADSNYAGNYVDAYAQYILEMHNAARSTEERQAIIDRTMRWGAHMFGLASRGFYIGAEPFQFDAYTAGIGNGGAGQYGGPTALMFAVAMMTRRADLLAIAHRANHKVMENAMWVDETFINMVPQDSTGPTTRAGTAFFKERIGTPELINDEFSASYDGRYRPIGVKTSGWELLAISAFQNGPGGVDGLAATLNGGAANTTNKRAAVAAMFDVMRSEYPTLSTSYGLPQSWHDAYDLIRPLSSVPAYTGPPSQPPRPDECISTPSNGTIRYTFNPTWEFATETVTQTDFRYSLDGRQWVVDADVTLNGSGQYDKSGLIPGALHWVGLRRHSASGASEWSSNAPVTIGGGARATITTTGTATAAAPSYTGGVAPALVFRTAPYWYTETWAETSDEDVINATEFAAGAGYIGSGYPAPTYTYAWKLDGSATGDTDYKTTIEPHEARGLTLACDVTATNASGNSGAQTASFTVPNYFGMYVPQSSPWQGGLVTGDTRTIDIGTAHADRWLVVVMTGKNSTTTPNAEVPGTLTIGGVSFTRVAAAHAVRSVNGSFAQVWVSDSKIPTGTTATATWAATSNGPNDWDGFVFQIIKSTAPTVVDTFTEGLVDTSGDGFSRFTLDSGSSGFVVGVAKIVSAVGGANIEILPKSSFVYQKTLRDSVNWIAVTGQHTLDTTFTRAVVRSRVALSASAALVTFS